MILKSEVTNKSLYMTTTRKLVTSLELTKETSFCFYERAELENVDGAEGSGKVDEVGGASDLLPLAFLVPLNVTVEFAVLV